MRGFLLLITGGALFFASAGKGEGVRGLLEHPERPRLEDLLRLEPADIEERLGGLGQPEYDEERVFLLYASILERLRVAYPAATFVLFGRDCESLYDAAVASSTSAELPRWQLAPISRELAKNSSATAIGRLLSSLRSGVPEVQEGTIVWLDTGARGTIYNHLLSKVLSLATGPDRAVTQARMARAFVPLLLQSRGTGAMEQLAEWLGRGARDESSIYQWADSYLYYDELGPSLLTALGIPNSFGDRSRWLVAAMEHTPKWGHRTHSVSEAGELHYEGVTRYTGTIDRRAHLRLQLRVLRRFRQPALACEQSLTGRTLQL